MPTSITTDFAPGCEPGVGHDTIILPAGGTTTLTKVLGTGSNITIEGNGHTLSGNNMYPHHLA